MSDTGAVTSLRHRPHPTEFALTSNLYPRDSHPKLRTEFETHGFDRVIEDGIFTEITGCSKPVCQQNNYIQGLQWRRQQVRNRFCHGQTR